jgi:hypothetical protein
MKPGGSKGNVPQKLKKKLVKKMLYSILMSTLYANFFFNFCGTLSSDPPNFIVGRSHPN